MGDELLGSDQTSTVKLLEARLWIARLGERDINGWWATEGILGRDGAFVGPRVLPKTHPTARARIAFAVAAHACIERHPDPTARSLFRLDPETEDRFDALLVERLGDQDWWAAIVSRLEQVQSGADIGSALLEAKLVAREDLRRVQSLSLGPDGRSLPIPPPETPEEALRILTAGFARSRARELAVPYLSNGK